MISCCHVKEIREYYNPINLLIVFSINGLVYKMFENSEKCRAHGDIILVLSNSPNPKDVQFAMI